MGHPASEINTSHVTYETFTEELLSPYRSGCLLAMQCFLPRRLWMTAARNPESAAGSTRCAAFSWHSPTLFLQPCPFRSWCGSSLTCANRASGGQVTGVKARGRGAQPAFFPSFRAPGAAGHLDTRDSARFLSYPGILLESWRGEHRVRCKAFDVRAPGLDSRGKSCRTGSRRQLGLRAAGGRVAEGEPAAVPGAANPSERSDQKGRAHGLVSAWQGALESSPDQARSIPGDKFSSGSRFQAGSACALNGGGLRPTG
jgi:hypothetical protein